MSGEGHTRSISIAIDWMKLDEIWNVSCHVFCAYVKFRITATVELNRFQTKNCPHNTNGSYRCLMSHNLMKPLIEAAHKKLAETESRVGWPSTSMKERVDRIVPWKLRIWITLLSRQKQVVLWSRDKEQLHSKLPNKKLRFDEEVKFDLSWMIRGYRQQQVWYE